MTLYSQYPHIMHARWESETLSVVSIIGTVGACACLLPAGTRPALASASSCRTSRRWAPPGASLTSSQTNSTLPSKSDATFAPEWPFWAIFGLTVLATIAMWFGYKQLVKGHRDGMLLGGGVSLIITVAALVAQWIQITTFPFGASNGAYASAVLLLCAENIFNLLILVFLHIGLLNRTRKGLISPLVYYQTKLVSYWMVWICISVLLGALLTTFLLDSPNTEPSIFGTFKLPS